MNDLSKLRGLLSRVYRGDKEARKLVEDAYASQPQGVREDIAEILDLLQEQEMLPDEVLDAILEELEPEDASG